MKSENGRNEYIEELREPRPHLGRYYRKYLGAGLDKLDEWLGETTFGGKALMTHTSLALFYAISFFAVSWVMGGSGYIGEIKILPEELSGAERFFGAVIFCAGMVAFVLIFKNHERIDSAIEKKGSKWLPKMAPGFLRWSYRLISGGALALIMILLNINDYAAGSVFLISVLLGPAFVVAAVFAFAFVVAVAVVVAVEGAVALAVAVAFAVAVAVAVAFADAFSFAVAVAFTVEGAFAGEVVGAFAGVFVGVGAVLAVALFVAGEKKYFWLWLSSSGLTCILFWALGSEFTYVKLDPMLASYLFFMIILPFINGMMDFISSGVSRVLGRKIESDDTFRSVLFHFGIDFIAAVLFLLSLAFGVAFATELFDLFVAKTPDLMINLPEIIERAKKDPLGGDGLWVSLMLFSTLIPTFCHFVIALGGACAVYIIPAPWRESMAMKLQGNGALSREWGGPIAYFSIRWPASVVAAVLFLWLAGLLIIHQMGRLSNGLASVAGRGIDFAHLVFDVLT